MCRNRDATGINIDWPSGNAPTTRVHRWISTMIR
jgi:hypothetical protein